MIDTPSDLLKIFFETSLIFLVLLIVYKKYIYSLFDPLLFFIITQAFSIEMAFLQISIQAYLINFIFCQILFSVGFLLIAKDIKGKYVIDDKDFFITKQQLDGLSYFTLISFLIILIANFYFMSVKGLIIFSKDPSLDKIQAFDSGGGIGAIRRINWGLLPLDSVCAMFLFLKTRKKRYLIILLILVLLTMSGGTKGAILIFVFMISILGVFSSIKLSKSFNNLNKIKIPILIIGLVAAIFIISATSENISSSLMSLGLRFLYFGDIILYYYTPESVVHFQKLNFSDYLSYEFNPLLGLLRVVPYTLPLGFQMVEYAFSHNENLESVFGPNIPFYVKGHIFFGAYGALIYSFLVGCIIGFCRKLLFSNSNKSVNYILILILIFFNLQIFAYPQDSSFFLSIIMDTVFFSIVPLIISIYLTLPVKKKFYNK